MSNSTALVTDELLLKLTEKQQIEALKIERDALIKVNEVDDFPFNFVVKMGIMNCALACITKVIHESNTNDI
ncbi:hypothetical protein [uncultured Pseudoalteromonas sp.]|uniref:hypothetical protein n=1 Tax=uncultured Pseudoalteromonas sp. TaxID=114053 RepID=UPI00259961D3|nr:hypothetical protein [uncultured Pseudoalteromonas sp.]